MDMKPDIMKKFKPRVPIKMCETCVHRDGDFFEDPENKDITRVYCKARYTTVNAEEMTRFCDFFTKKIDI